MRLSERWQLHPSFRVHFDDLAAKASVLQLKPYELARTPQRQVELYSRGRGVGITGKTVTRAKAWQSFHQYGVAADFVFYVNGQWTWEEPRKGAWAEFQNLAKGSGLRVLSFEIPHVELPVSLADLQAGRYPHGGDETWESWIEDQIEQWGHESRLYSGITHPGAPPMPTLEHRPTEDVWAGLPNSPFA